MPCLKSFVSLFSVSWMFQKCSAEVEILSRDYIRSRHSSVSQFLRQQEDIISEYSVNTRALQSTTSIAGQLSCSTLLDCNGGYGQCIDGYCRSFTPDLTQTNIITCVDGYNCYVAATSLPTLGIDVNFRVRAIPPGGYCTNSSAAVYSKGEALFGTNEWSCSSDSTTTGCAVSLGAGVRLDKTVAANAVQMCGCPDADFGGDGYNCNQNADFGIPVAVLVVQECTTNAHCADSLLAYCNDGKCGSYDVLGMAAGVTLVGCLSSSTCTFTSLLSNMTSTLTSSMFSVITVADNLSCGSSAALDADYIEDNSMPCLVTGTDGTCEINLGAYALTGASRLCGCSNSDAGGDGIPCNQPEDFVEDIGLMSLGECVVYSDCANGYFCFGGTCYADTTAPTFDRFDPPNDTYSVPPLNSFLIEFTESVTLVNSAGTVTLKSDDGKVSYSVIIGKTTSSQTVDFSNYILIINPNLKQTTFAEGSYTVTLSAGAFADKQGNTNAALTNYRFHVRSDAGCPLMYATGFYPGTSSSLNPNGNYSSNGVVNGKASWKSSKYYVYWNPDTSTGYSGYWVLDTDTTPTSVVAYSDPEGSNYARDKQRPFSGSWNIAYGTSWLTQPVNWQCAQVIDTTPPVLQDIVPAIESIDHPVANPIKLTFNEEVFYGQTGVFYLYNYKSATSETLSPAAEGTQRGKYIISNGNNTVFIQHPQGFKFGQKYCLSATAGALVDTRNNMWGEVPQGILNFTTYGVDCAAYTSPGSDFIVTGTGVSHLSVRSLTCIAGKSPDTTFTQPHNITCINGKWETNTMLCYKNCATFPTPTTAYALNSNSSNHGAVSVLSCQDGYSATNGTSPQSLTCRNGVWDTQTLVCSKSCSAYPTLSSAYLVSGTGVNDGATRILLCSSTATPAKGSQPEVISCKAGSWSTPVLDCRQMCSSFTQTFSNGTVTGSGFVHGAIRTLQCNSGYGLTTGKAKEISTCIDGTWTTVSASCLRTCSELTLGSGYVLSGSGILDGASRSVSCASGAVQSGSSASSEYVTCLSGSWSSLSMVCKARCLAPASSLGAGYALASGTLSDSSMIHGSTAQLICATGATQTAGTLLETVVCNDGKWLTITGSSPSLKCMAPCSPLTTLSTAYVVDGGQVTSAHGVSATVSCATGYLAQPSTYSSIRYTCTDSVWVPQVTDFYCAAPCSRTALEATFGSSYTYSQVFTDASPLAHGSSLTVSCTSTATTYTNHPTAAVTTCNNGVWARTDVLCVPQSCSDGVKNGLETGVDCGGTCVGCPTCSDGFKNGNETGIDCGTVCSVSCNATCTDSIKNGDESYIDCGGSCGNTANCPSTCGDDLRNGDETGVDCGGSCGACGACTQFTAPNGVIIEPSRLFSSASPPHGSVISLRCAYGFYPTYNSTVLSGTTTVTCQNSQWSTLPFTCSTATCSDGKMNGDEEGYDCGGSCSQKCSTCSDGVQNGDETGIDCGGSCPSGCTRCSMPELKALDANPAFKLTPVTAVETTQYGQQWTLSCSSKAKVVSGTSGISVYCQNTEWSPALTSLQCALNEDSVDDLSVFKLPTDVLQDTLNSACTTATNSNSLSCCGARASLLNALNTAVNVTGVSTCADLLFSQATSKVSQFCTSTSITSSGSTCQNIALNSLTTYSSRTGTGCTDVSSLTTLVNTFCALDSANTPCFAHAGTHHQRMLLTSLATSSNLSSYCTALSCFRYNLKYFETLAGLGGRTFFNDINGIPSTSASSSSSRRLRADSHLTSSAIASSELNLALNMLDAFDSSFPEKASNNIERRRLLVRMLQSAGNAADYSAILADSRIAYATSGSEPDIRGYRANSVSSSIFDALCTNVSGQSCASTIISLAFSNPVLTPPSGTPCSDTCLAASARALGKALGNSNTQYGSVIGSLLKVYGTYYCSKNSKGDTCGSLLFPSMAAALPRGRSSIADATITSSCPTSCRSIYIGDGHCDDACFKEECNWDGGDCSVQTAYPLTTRAALTGLNLLSLRDSCHPLSTSMSCASGSDCRTRLSAALTNMGCCFGPAVEILREVLKFEITVAKTIANVEGTEWTTSTDGKLLAVMDPDLSLHFVEQQCEFSLDQTCSLSKTRTLVKIGATVKGVNYNDLTLSSSGSSILTSFASNIQSSIASVAGVPSSSVTTVNFWTGSVAVESTIEVPSAVASELLTSLGDSQANGQLYTAFKTAVDQTGGLTTFLESGVTALTIPAISVYFNGETTTGTSASSAIAAALPLMGTLGMGTYTSLLNEASCSSSLNLNVPTDSAQEDVYRVVDNSMGSILPGAARTVYCQTGYNAIADTGTSPQSLTCSNGRWGPPTGQILIVCRKPCTAEPTSAEVESKGFVLTGSSSSNSLDHGVTRGVSCANELASSALNGEAYVTCDNGSWVYPAMICSSCTVDGLSSTLSTLGKSDYVVNSADDTSGVITCPDGSISAGTQITVSCDDSLWNVDQLRDVFSSCESSKSSTGGESKSKGGSSAGIIVGVIIGVAAIAGIIAFLIIRHKRKQKELNSNGSIQKKRNTYDDEDDRETQNSSEFDSQATSQVTFESSLVSPEPPPYRSSTSSRHHGSRGRRTESRQHSSSREHRSESRQRSSSRHVGDRRSSVTEERRNRRASNKENTRGVDDINSVAGVTDFTSVSQRPPNPMASQL